MWDRLAGRRWSTRQVLAALGAGLALGLLVLLVPQLLQLLDPERAVRELAVRDARASAERDYAQQWRDHSSCWQARNPQGEWTGQQRANERGGGLPPADTRYSVVAVRSDGVYKRVEVRVQLPAYPPEDYEIDERQYGGRWVVVDRGDMGRYISDDCVGGQGH